MSIGKDGSQRPVPTLTEVVQLSSDAAGAGRNPTNPVVTPTLRKMSVDDTKKVGNDAARNRLATVLPPPTLPPVLALGSLPVASSPIAMPSPVFAAVPPMSPVPPVVAVEPQAPVAPVARVAPVAPVARVASRERSDSVERTETIEPLPSQPAALVVPVPVNPAVAALVAEPAPVPAPAQGIGSAEESRIVERVLADVQQHIDLLLEHRLREALAPAFERIAQSLLVETRATVSHSLRDVVAASVARELERVRVRNE